MFSQKIRRQRLGIKLSTMFKPNYSILSQKKFYSALFFVIYLFATSQGANLRVRGSSIAIILV